MKYTPEEIAELLKDKLHQPHYIAAMVRKAVAAERSWLRPVITAATSITTTEPATARTWPQRSAPPNAGINRSREAASG